MQKSSSKPNPCKAPLGHLAQKGSFLTAPEAPGSPWAQQHLAQLDAPAYTDSPVLPVDVVLEFMVLEFKVLDLETGLLGEQGQLLCYREFCGAHPVAGVQERQI